jgi:hypothetical protein
LVPAVFARAPLLRHGSIDAAAVRQEPPVHAGAPIEQLSAVI